MLKIVLKKQKLLLKKKFHPDLVESVPPLKQIFLPLAP
jgi:hypothetical protein